MYGLPVKVHKCNKSDWLFIFERYINIRMQLNTMYVIYCVFKFGIYVKPLIRCTLESIYLDKLFGLYWIKNALVNVNRLD